MWETDQSAPCSSSGSQPNLSDSLVWGTGETPGEAREAMDPEALRAVTAHDLGVIRGPYVGIGLVILVVLVIIAVTKMPRTENHGDRLDSLLIKPVQRLCKYPLFFRELLALLRTADVGLDPLYFGGDGTTREALEVALPVVSMPSAGLGSLFDFLLNYGAAAMPHQLCRRGGGLDHAAIRGEVAA